jgi:hypothetical protein
MNIKILPSMLLNSKAIIAKIIKVNATIAIPICIVINFIILLRNPDFNFFVVIANIIKSGIKKIKFIIKINPEPRNAVIMYSIIRQQLPH